MESVILPDDTKERILEDVEDFYSKDAAQVKFVVFFSVSAFLNDFLSSFTIRFALD